MKGPRLLFFIVAICAAGGCHRGIKLSSTIPAAPGDVRTLYALQYTDVALGTGAAAEAEKCLYTHYTGWLVDGRKFDSSRDTTSTGQPRTPLVFRQGARQVISGWDSGFEGMNVGGRRRLFIPYQIAYGEKGRPPIIPAKALLVFDVELMDVTDAPAVPQGTPPAQVRCKPWAERRS